MKVFAILLASAASVVGQSALPLPGIANQLVAKNFYLLARVDADSGVRRQLDGDTVLRKMGDAKRAAMTKAFETCAIDATCHFAAIRLTDEEIETAAVRLRELASAKGPLQSLVAGPLRDSGVFIRYHAMSDAALIETAWRDAAKGINRLIEVYGQGKPGRYPAIDSIAYDASSEIYRRLVAALMGTLDTSLAPSEAFFTPSLRFATELMMLNRRDEAARHEPMEAGENRAAWKAAQTTRWADYPYTVVVIPGAGGTDLTTRLSAAGRLRSMVAAQRWKSKQAPFVLVSGGYVHPNQTPFAEAIEMKRLLMQEFGLPEAAIIVDPHARHTTTNMRNAARLMFRYGFPMDRPAVVSTDPGQSAYIEAPLFAERCRKELGYLPYRLGKRLTRFDQEFFALLESLHGDNTDPLDP
jgi:hypothetical protein